MKSDFCLDAYSTSPEELNLRSDLILKPEVRGRTSRYFQRLYDLSELEETHVISAIFFPSNEPHPANIPELATLRGDYFGTSIDQNFTYLVNSGFNPDRDNAYTIDFNRVVTEGVLPYVLALIDSAPTRIEFLSYLLHRPVTPKDILWSQDKSLGEILSRLYSKGVNDVNSARQQLQAFSTTLLADIVEKIKDTSGNDIATNLRHWVKWFAESESQDDIFTHDFRYQNSPTENVWGWLARESAYQRLLPVIKNEHFTGISANWTGKNGIRRLIGHQKENNRTFGLGYMSNIHDKTTPGSEPEIARNMRDLPISSTFKVIWSEGRPLETRIGSLNDYLSRVAE